MSESDAYFKAVCETLGRLPRAPVDELVRGLREAFAEGRRVFVFGNGGSAATASHFVTDMVKGATVTGRPRPRVVCLNDNVPMLTAYGNDVGYDSVFAEPLAALAQPGDVALAISGSGNSPNVLRAMETAAKGGIRRLGLSGFAGGRLLPLCDLCVVVPSDSMQVIEDVHLVILHATLVALTRTP